MAELTHLNSIGVMTGNSLDGVDVVLTRFYFDGGIEDLKAHSLSMPPHLKEKLLAIREAVCKADGDFKAAETSYNEKNKDESLESFDAIQKEYVLFVSIAVKELINQVEKKKICSIDEIDLIGFHGQTCAHLPPSIANKTGSPVYTCQMGDGQFLADLTGITVVYDFRSDDIINSGEGAPLAPVHHEHLAGIIKEKGNFPIAFFNAGNTGNISVISKDTANGETVVSGWDAGPFNNYPDKLVFKEHKKEMDKDGRFGKKGKINKQLLKLLFDKAVVTTDGDNFFELKPPKSSDPQWYRELPELFGEEPVDGSVIPFNDRLRTAEYFSAYAMVLSLAFIPENIQMPGYFALCGGGWKNPLARGDFEKLLTSPEKCIVLDEHQKTFEKIKNRLDKKPEVDWSIKFGFDGGAMEARIFADAAVSRVKGEPFTTPQTTGAAKSVVCGIIKFPNHDETRATNTLLEWLDNYKSLNMTCDKPDLFDCRWSRASAGWQNLLAKC